jgi:hypothetical protein
MGAVVDPYANIDLNAELKPTKNLKNDTKSKDRFAGSSGMGTNNYEYDIYEDSKKVAASKKKPIATS